jgi:hypothetical protein
MTKSIAKKSATKPTKARKPNALHEKLFALMKRPTGADLHELKKPGWKAAAAAALALAKRHGMKVNVIKKRGELARYTAKAGAAK